MKKIGILIGFLVFFSDFFACDHCNVFLSINPNDYQHNIGFQYRSRLHYGKFNTNGLLMQKHGGETHTKYSDQEVFERYSRFEITGQYFINQKWNIQAVLPYVNNQEIVDGRGVYDVWGIGDPIIIQNYQLFNTKDIKDTTFFSQRFSVGMGLKMPLGSINQSFGNGTPNLDLQSGTGSWDAIITSTYISKYKNLGFILNANYKLNTFNSDNYKYGNTTNLLANLFYQIKLKNIVVMPMIGGYTELANNDYQGKIKQVNSDGQLLFGDANLSIFIKKLRLQVNYQHGFASLLNDSNQLKTLYKINFNITYNI